MSTPALLRLLRTLPGSPEAIRAAVYGDAGAEVAARSGPADAALAQLVADAGKHGLSAVLAHALSSAQIQLPGASAHTLRQHALSISAFALKTKRLLLKTLDAFAAQGVTPLLLKGYGLGARIYPDPLLRPTSDVDLLVRREDQAKAEAALVGMGLRRTEEAAEAYSREHHHHLNFYGQEGLVELHFHALTGFGVTLTSETLFRTARSFTLEGRTVLHAAPEEELLYLATHAANHLMQRLSWLYDLKLLHQQSTGLDWGRVVALAEETGVRGPLFFALEAAHRAVDLPVPSEVLKALRPSRVQGAVCDVVFSDQRLVDIPLSTNKWGVYAVMPLLSSDLRSMTRFTLHHLWRGTRRKIAQRFPNLSPLHWNG